MSPAIKAHFLICGHLQGNHTACSLWILVHGMRKTIEPQLTKQNVHTVPLYILLAEESRIWLDDFKGALIKFYVLQALLHLRGFGLCTDTYWFGYMRFLTVCLSFVTVPLWFHTTHIHGIYTSIYGCTIVKRGWKLYPRALWIIHGSGGSGHTKIHCDELRV